MIIYSRTAVSQDSDGNLNRLTTTGPHQDELKITDQINNQHLEMIYEQLKILNFQMATITENSIEEDDNLENINIYVSKIYEMNL